MKILGVAETIFPEVKVIKYARFHDERGFFAETYKESDFKNNPQLSFLRNIEIKQANVSYSKINVIRGLHFQWNPVMGKLIRTIKGRMIDLFLDIRPESPTFGKIGAFDLPSQPTDETNVFIWVPAGFAHGSVFTEDTIIEYYCTSEWSPQTEASISPFAPDIDWSLCDPNLKEIFDQIKTKVIISAKDRDGFNLEDWKKNPASKNFIF